MFIKKYTLPFVLLFIGTLLAVSSCDNRLTQPGEEEEPLPEETTFIPFRQATQSDSIGIRAKGTQPPPSEFGCALSTLNPEDHNQRYRYQAFYIQFPPSVMREAVGKVSQRGFALRSGRSEQRTPKFLGKDGVVRYLTCRIPDSPKAEKILQKEMHKFGTKSWYNDLDNQEKGKSKSNVEVTCRYEPGDGYGNISSTITFAGYTKVTYYFHEVCEYVPNSGPQDQEFYNDGEFGGGGGSYGSPDNSNDNPNPCESVGGSQDFSQSTDSGGIIGCEPANIISTYPLVRYPEGSDYATRYPKLTEYLKNQLPTLKNNNVIINAIEKYGDLSSAEIKEHLQWGKGPIIKIKQLDQDCGQNCYGLFSSTESDVLKIDIDLVNDLENTSLGTSLADAFSFLVGVTVLHEYVHFSEWSDGSWNNPESGTLFEQDVYGQTVWRHNAEIILKRN